MKMTAPPEHLSDAMVAWWKRLARRYGFRDQHYKVLQCAAESWDEKTEAHDLWRREGMVTRNRFGEPRPHPAVKIENAARISFVRCVRELALADDDLPGAASPRPPRLKGYKGRD